MRYVAFIHHDSEPGCGISFPDFPGCVSDGDTTDEAIRRGGEALAFHLEGMIKDNQEIPTPCSLEEIQRDPSLQEWREGAALCFVPVIFDKGSPRRINTSIDYGLFQTIDEEA